MSFNAANFRPFIFCESHVAYCAFIIVLRIKKLLFFLYVRTCVQTAVRSQMMLLIQGMVLMYARTAVFAVSFYFSSDESKIAELRFCNFGLIREPGRRISRQYKFLFHKSPPLAVCGSVPSAASKNHFLSVLIPILFFPSLCLPAEGPAGTRSVPAGGRLLQTADPVPPPGSGADILPFSPSEDGNSRTTSKSTAVPFPGIAVLRFAVSFLIVTFVGRTAFLQTILSSQHLCRIIRS